MLGEVWKDIEDYEGYYMISNFGRVKSLRRNRYVGCKAGIIKERILKTTLNTSGYELVKLYFKGKPKFFRVHQLVARHFIENKCCYPIINHIDGNKRNNKADNLEWCTYSKNAQHAMDNGLNKTRFDCEISKFMDMYITKRMKQDEIARYYGVSSRTIAEFAKRHNIQRRQIYNAVKCDIKRQELQKLLEHHTGKEVAKISKCSEATISNYKKKYDL